MKIVKKILKGLLIFIVVMIVLCIIMIPFDLKNQKVIRKMTINEVDLSTLDDGVYEGHFNKFRWIYDTKVSIKDHAITDIKITENSSQPGSYRDELINRVIKEQKINVDTVAGATISTKAMLKAIEDALN